MAFFLRRISESEYNYAKEKGQRKRWPSLGRKHLLIEHSSR